MKVIWSKQAAERLHEVASYIRQEYGRAAKQRFLDQVYQLDKLLSTEPAIGKVEPLLAHEDVVYRSIVMTHLNKIVYWVNGDTIEIVALWDTRKEPRRQADDVLH
ncbi:MAG: type II toxin-antitoxin system RelE/ParE family toxin [Paludibacteraceae bacterium]|nr:type II toxin-antitoxin system RelE/ParE family toxin [Paludibacteraceae bacterium]